MQYCDLVASRYTSSIFIVVEESRYLQGLKWTIVNEHGIGIRSFISLDDAVNTAARLPTTP